MYSNSYSCCSFKPEIIKIGQSSHKIYSNNIVNFRECTTILNGSRKKSGNLLNALRIKTCGLLNAIFYLCISDFLFGLLDFMAFQPYLTPNPF